VKRERKDVAENVQSFSTCPNLSVVPTTNAFFGFFILCELPDSIGPVMGTQRPPPFERAYCESRLSASGLAAL